MDGEGLQTVHKADGTPAEFLRGDRERQSGKADEQSAKGDLGLHTGQGSPQAIVDTVEDLVLALQHREALALEEEVRPFVDA